MRPLAGIGRTTAPTLDGRAPRNPTEPEAPPATRTAVVAVVPARPPDASLTSGRRPLSAFVAQLIATQRREPQTRERRRAEPADAIARYASASAAPTVRPPVVLRSL